MSRPQPRILLTLAVALASGAGRESRAQVMTDPNLQVETVVTGIPTPTSMAFLGPDDFLVLEKAGNVRRVQDGVLAPLPVLSVPVNFQSERGSGWVRLMGPSSNNPGALALLFHVPNEGSTYSDPEFSFNQQGCDQRRAGHVADDCDGLVDGAERALVRERDRSRRDHQCCCADPRHWSNP